MEPSPDHICNQLHHFELNPLNIEFEESSLEFYETIPSLEEISSFVVAIESWRQFIINEDPNRDTHYKPKHVFYFLDEEDETKVKNSLENLPLPRLIRDRIVECLDPVKREINEWARYYVQSVFRSKRYDLEGAIKISDLMYCHWSPDGKIDHRKSALNMLSNPRLNSTDKFRIACKYCLEQEMKKLPADSIDEDIPDLVKRFDRNPLEYYWLYRMSNALDKLPKKNESIEAFLITTPSVDSWSSIEYFWNHLSIDEQIAKALILLYRNSQFQKEILFKMSEYQKQQILSVIPIDIVKNFWNKKSCERFAFLSWIRGVSSMTYEQFTSLIEDLLSVSLPHHNERIRYLVKMWECSPDHFKTKAARSISKKVIFLHTEICWTRWEGEAYLPSNLDFLIAFLASADVEFRKKVLMENVEKFVLCNSSPMINELVKVCLPNTSDLVEFRNFLFDSPEVQSNCYEMLVGSFDDRQNLAKFLLNYFPDPIDKADFIIMLIWSQSWSDDSMGHWNDAINLINVNLDVEPNEAKIIMKLISSSFATTRVQFSWNIHHVHLFIAIVTSILDTEELIEYKTLALETFRSRYEWFEFCEDDIRSFLKWCFDEDDHQIDQFRRSLSIDEIFDYCWKDWKRAGLLEEDLGSKLVYKEFALLDKILLWYFESSDDVKKYKTRKAFDLCDGADANSEVNEFFAINILPWFFDGDLEEILKFKDRFKDDPVFEIIDFLPLPIDW